jgi:hypothetical protein
MWPITWKSILSSRNFDRIPPGGYWAAGKTIGGQQAACNSTQRRTAPRVADEIEFAAVSCR